MATYLKDVDKFLNFIKSKVSDNVSFASGGNNITCNCPKCEKGAHKRHGHLYISLVDPVFNCFKCSFKGHISKLFREFNVNIYDYVLSSVLNASYIYSKKVFSISNNEIDYKDYKEIDNNEIYKSKEKYLLNRIKDLDNIDLIPNLILNIKKLLNSIKDLKEIYPKLTDDDIENYNNNYVGFLSINKSLLIMRCINNTDKKRYKTLKLNKEVENSFFKDFYGIKNYNNLTETFEKSIILCEGVFDLLGCYFNKDLQSIRNKGFMFGAALGNSYNNIIPSVLDYCKLPCSNFIILSDSDLKEKSYNFINYNQFMKNVKVYWNRIGKDFGEKNIEYYSKDFIKLIT